MLCAVQFLGLASLSSLCSPIWRRSCLCTEARCLRFSHVLYNSSLQLPRIGVMMSPSISKRINSFMSSDRNQKKLQQILLKASWHRGATVAIAATGRDSLCCQPRPFYHNIILLKDEWKNKPQHSSLSWHHVCLCSTLDWHGKDLGKQVAKLQGGGVLRLLPTVSTWSVTNAFKQ